MVKRFEKFTLNFSISLFLISANLHHPYPSLVLYIPLTNRVRGPYLKLRTKFFPPCFMAQAQSTRAINRRGKNENP